MNVLRYPCILSVPTAVALGRFDGVHLAHKAVISAAAKDEAFEGAVFTFSDNPNKSPSALLTTEEEKVSRIRDCGIKHLVSATFDSVRDLSAEEFVDVVLCKSLNAKTVYCGYNYRFGKGASADINVLRALCEVRGIRLTAIDEVTVGDYTVSSTAIRNLLTEGKIEKANLLLGRNYSLNGQIVHGNAIGRTIDTPTLNIDVCRDKLLPMYGVYATFAHIDGRLCRAVTNIGVKPTVGSSAPTVETYLLDNSGDFYGKSCTVELVAFLRKEEKFQSLEALKAAIASDIRKATDILK